MKHMKRHFNWSNSIHLAKKFQFERTFQYDDNCGNLLFYKNASRR